MTIYRKGGGERLIADRQQKIQKMILLRERKIRKARESFWEFCLLMDSLAGSKIFKRGRKYLEDYCNTLQGIYDGTIRRPDGSKYEGALISFPPRHGKSYTLTLFSAWLLGKNSQKSIITVGYNVEMGQGFSKNTRNIISHPKDYTKIVYNDVFPTVMLKRGDSSVKTWSVEGSFFSYLGTGFDGTITGKGASLALIIDDPVKNADEAFNAARLDEIYDTYVNTLKSRVEAGALTFIIQTRWSKRDLIGRILDSPEADKYYIVNYKAYNPDTNEMLCQDVFSYKRYLEAQATMSDIIFLANYQQELVDLKGGLYAGIQQNVYNRTFGYDEFERRVAYVDVATSGKDYFAAVFAGIKDNKVYILDAIYTQDNIDVTEPLLIQKLRQHQIVECMIESNSAGGIFASNIRKELSKQSIPTIINEYNQSKNKETRLLVNAPFVLNHVLFPNTFKSTHSDAWEHILTFKKDNRQNKHDDIEDALTGLIEHFVVGLDNQKTSVNVIYQKSKRKR